MRKKISSRSIDKIIADCETTYEKSAHFGEAMAYLLWDYNMRLIDYYEAIREAQPVAHGAVLLDLKQCGKTCMGCPHPYWSKWVNRNRENPKSPPTWFAVKIARPSASARAKHIPEHARTLISEAQTFIKQRDSLIRSIGRLRRVIAGHKQANPDLGHIPEGSQNGSKRY